MLTNLRIEELRVKEGGWIRQIGTLNEHIATRDEREWYDDHREQQLEKMNTYREKHKDTVIASRKNHGENNIEAIREYDRRRYAEHTEKRIAVVKRWYNENREKLLTIIHCDCDGTYQIGGRKRHLRTKRHQQYVSQE